MKLLLSAALGAAAGIYLWTWANSEPSVMPIFIDGGAPEISAQSVCEGKTEGACGIPGRGVEDFVNKLVPTILAAADVGSMIGYTITGTNVGGVTSADADPVGPVVPASPLAQ
jgi:hypothetical protein